MVDGKFDLEANFVVKDSDNVKHLLKFMEHVPEKLQVRDAAFIYSRLCSYLLYVMLWAG